MESLPPKRRENLVSYAPATVMDKLYWNELKLIISKQWKYFERIFGDKKRFQAVMDLINDRPDTHAKEIDSADVALYRRELSWLEGKVLS